MDPRYPTNVKIPEEYVLLIDENLRLGNLAKFRGRAHVVRTAVYEFLLRNEIHPKIRPDDIGQQS